MRDVHTLNIMCAENGCKVVELANISKFKTLQSLLEYMAHYRCRQHRATEADLYELEEGGLK